MARTKLKKLNEIKTFPNVFDTEDERIVEQIKKYFNNTNSLTLELGCGEADYTINLAREYPERNFIGIDIKAARVYVGAKRAMDEGIKNAGFLTCRVERLPEIFKNEKIHEIYIPFPDPHVRRTSAPRRLVSPEKMIVYKQILGESGIVHFKTDNDELFEYALTTISKENVNVIKKVYDVHSNNELSLPEKITTRYERHYLKEGRTINYVCFSFIRDDIR